MARTPFEINYNFLYVGYSKKLDVGLYFRTTPKHWLRNFWNHPEADVLWYDIGPFAFFKRGL